MSRNNTKILSKWKLRRYFLDKYFGEKEFSVLDCCAGEGLVWRKLREEYNVRYVGYSTC
jgi:ubiquinone/menaquinone biosynthesis C-methylase UbiE